MFSSSCSFRRRSGRTITMGTLRIMSRRGDDRIVWDLQKAETGDVEALAAVHEAERIFTQERILGATAFKIEAGQSPARVDHFDQRATQIILVPRVIGGATPTLTPLLDGHA